MKRRIFAALLTIAMTVSFLSGCSMSGASSKEGAAADSDATEGSIASEEASEDVQEITWFYWDDLDATEDLISKGYKETLERFNNDYKGKYHVTAITEKLDKYYTKLNALIASDECPDVFIVSPGPNLTAYVDPGTAADLTPYLDAEWKGSFSGDAVFAQQTYDGRIYAIPLNIAAACVFYNKEMFEEAGAAVPKTWDELLTVCEKIRAKGHTPITISAGTSWCLSMLAGYLCDREGVDLKKIEAGEESWNNPKTISAANRLLQLSQYFQPTAAEDTNVIATAGLYNGEAAILIQGSWAIAGINGENPDFEKKCGVFQFPEIPGGNDPNRVIAKCDSLAMSADTEYPEACIALMKYFTDDTAQKYTAEVGGKIPVTKVKYDMDKAPSQLADVMSIFSNASSTFGFYDESLFSAEAGSIFDDSMVDIYLGEKTPEQAFDYLDAWYKANK